MSRASGVLAALKAVPGGARYTPAPQSGGAGRISPVASNALYGNPYQNTYGPFLPRPSRTFTDGAFGPGAPIQPMPVDEPAIPGGFPDPRRWQYPVTWNLPTQPGTEGLKLASFAQLATIASKYNVARRAIELRKEEIAGLEWEIQLTTKAAKAYQGDHKAMRDFGERAAMATKFFRHPDPDYFDFQSFLKALLEEIFVYDALCLVFRPKYGKGLGRGLLGSDLDSLNLVSGPTIRPLLNMHGGKPRPPAPCYQQYIFGVPRSDFQTVISGADIDDYGLAGAEINQFRADTMLYLPLVPRRESPYGFPPIEQALLPIISGLQKQEFQLSYFTEGTVPAVYISPGDPNMTPTQIRELQDALNGIAGDPAYHLKVIVLPPGSKTEPQRPVDLSDSFDYLVMNQVLMQLDVMPTELGIVPDIGANTTGPSASGIRFGAQSARDPKSRKSTKPLLMTLCGIANYVLQDICGQQDMEFSFEGLQDDEDKAAITTLGVEQVQNGIASIDEVRDRLDMPPWGLQETSEPVVFTAQGPIPFSMAPQLIAGMQGGSQGTNSGQRTASSRSRTSQPSVRRGGQTTPSGSHPKPLAPHREAATPGHSAAAGAVQGPSGRTGGTTSRSPVAGSRKRGEGHTDLSRKAVASELDALRRHLRKGRLISTWVAEHIPERALGIIAEDIAKGVLIDTAVERAQDICLRADMALIPWRDTDHLERAIATAGGEEEFGAAVAAMTKVAPAHWPGWEHDLGLVGAYKQQISQAFHDAETRGSDLRKKAATGGMFVSSATLRDLISDEVREVFSGVLTPLWEKAYHLGYTSAAALLTGEKLDPWGTMKGLDEHVTAFVATEGEHWLAQIAKTGLGNNSVRSESIAWSEAGRAIGTAAIQCYRDYGVTHKHLLLSPNACDICKEAAEDGDIPLDAPFSAGGVIGQVHIRCRCAPGPAGIDVEPPLADLGKASGYSLNPRSGMISLDVPEGTIAPVPGGVTDHHITVVYLGPDVDDDAFASACQRAAIAAASMPGPLAGAISGLGWFPPSDSSDGKVPVWAGVMLPGAEVLREALEDLSASEHKDWKPHVTLAYVDAADDLPAPLAPVPVTFTHLSVHRGHGEVVRLPLGPAGKSAPAEDESRAGFLMMRARHPDDGKWRYLLQKRPDGGWGLPGGSTHAGEPPHAAAIREAREEIGDLPPLGAPLAVMQYPGEDKTAWVHLHEVPFFQPANNGSTPEETAGTGWFKRREVGDLDLHPPFRRQWESAGWHHVGKAAAPLQRMVNENGEVLTLTPASQALQAVGSRWPYPHRADGTEWPDAGPGSVPDPHGSAGGEPPHRVDDFAEPDPHGDVAPRGSDDGKMPSRGRKPAPPAEAFPDQGSEHDDAWPYPQATLTPAPALSVGASTGVPPSGEKRAKVSKGSVNYRRATSEARPADRDCGNCAMFHPGPNLPPIGTCDLVDGRIRSVDICDRWEACDAEKNDSGHPVVGSVPAKTPAPYKPHAVPPEAFDPAEAVEDWNPEGDTDEVHALPHSRKGASDYGDPNPVEPEHVKNLMRSNFPEPAIDWVGRSSWVGPVDIPWDRINDHSIDSWAASHQPAKVAEFARELKKDQNSVKPSICIQGHDGDKVDIIDGHHRGLAHKKLGQPVRCYLGTVTNPKDVQAALETHAMQYHAGSDPRNKSAQTSAEVLREYWTHQGHPGPTQFALEEKIRWGEPGDWYRCVDELTPYIGGEGAKGYCNLRHKEVLGYYPAQHAQMDEGK